MRTGNYYFSHVYIVDALLYILLNYSLYNLYTHLHQVVALDDTYIIHLLVFAYFFTIDVLPL